MKHRKTLFTILALVLVCAISVFGTLAYLAQSANTVTNTFIAAGGGKLVDSIVLKEHEYNATNDGIPGTLGVELVESNSYDLIPANIYPKDPFVNIQGKTEVDAYLYLKPVDSTGGAITWSIDSSKWLLLEAGLYVYTLDGTNPAVIDNTSTGLDHIGIIADNQITVAANADLSELGTGKTLSFEAYIAQTISGMNAIQVFNTCFSSSSD